VYIFFDRNNNIERTYESSHIIDEAKSIESIDFPENLIDKAKALKRSLMFVLLLSIAFV
jgi:hypothetical protein